MKWQRGYQSDDVEDDRGRSDGLGSGGGGGGNGLANLALMIGSRFGLPGIVVALGVVFVVPRLLGGGAQALSPGSAQATGSAQGRAGSDEQKQFVSFVFDDAQRTWSQRFTEIGQPYHKAASSCCSPIARPRAAATAAPRWVRFIVRPMSACTST